MHCEHIGFFSSHFSFLCRQVRLRKMLVDGTTDRTKSTCHPVRERMLKSFDVCGSSQEKTRCYGAWSGAVWVWTDVHLSRGALFYIYISMTVGDESAQHAGWMRGLAWFAPVRILRHSLSCAL